MILWQRQVTPQWLATNERLLATIASRELAVISSPARTRSLVQITCRRQRKAEKLVREFGGVARRLPHDWWHALQTKTVPPPIRIGRRLEIVGEPPKNSTNKPQLIIPAAGAFGTGEHATTAMSLRLLEEATRTLSKPWRLLDVGTGTGILAFAARRFGAAEVLGLDNDPRAIAHARQNARLNHISRAKFVRADLLQWKPAGRYDLITANLFSELLIAALPMLRRALRSDGHLIVSGFLGGQSDSVARAFRHARFRLEAQRRRGKWIAARWARR